MTTLLPRDGNGEPIPALRLKPDGAHVLTLGPDSARNATAFSAETRVIAVHATSPAFVRTGGGDVVAAATDHYLPAGMYLFLSLGDGNTRAHTHIAAVQAEGEGTLHVSELE